jgi:hypothetical protein
MFDAKTSIEFILVLNGQDDIGVEGFIKRVREARAECKETRALLRLILTKRIVGKAERSIRHSVIEYGDFVKILTNQYTDTSKDSDIVSMNLYTPCNTKSAIRFNEQSR